MPSIESMLNRIARAHRFAAAMSTEEARDRFSAIAVELIQELEVMQNQPHSDGGTPTNGAGRFVTTCAEKKRPQCRELLGLDYRGHL
jgi:hypothetical protein